MHRDRLTLFLNTQQFDIGLSNDELHPFRDYLTVNDYLTLTDYLTLRNYLALEDYL